MRDNRMYTDFHPSGGGGAVHSGRQMPWTHRVWADAEQISGGGTGEQRRAENGR